jgi:hypothetical protein
VTWSSVAGLLRRSARFPPNLWVGATESRRDVPVDLRKCGLSSWTGSASRCHWCNAQLTGRQRSWCSPKCYRVFTANHRYSSARSLCRRSARSKCGCPPESFIVRSHSRAGTLVTRRAPAHATCVVCGKCEVELGSQLECNHIVPRLGVRASYSCMHHQDNLEMVCHSDHAVKTAEQRKLWPTRASLRGPQPAVNREPTTVRVTRRRAS